MAFFPIPNTVRAVLRFQQGTEERQNVLHYHKDSGVPNDGDLLTIATTLSNWWSAVGKGMSASNLSLFEIVVTDISVANGHQLSQPVSPPVAGTRGADASPGNVTVTGSWRTPNTGRRFRGRSYWPGLVESDTTVDSLLTGAAVTALSAVFSNLLFGYVPTGYTLAVKSGVAHIATPITRVIVENTLDSMRRRLPKRGI